MFMQNDGTVKAVPSFCAFKKIKQIRFRLKSEDFSRTKSLREKAIVPSPSQHLILISSYLIFCYLE